LHESGEGFLKDTVHTQKNNIWTLGGDRIKVWKRETVKIGDRILSKCEIFLEGVFSQAIILAWENTKE